MRPNIFPTEDLQEYLSHNELLWLQRLDYRHILQVQYCGQGEIEFGREGRDRYNSLLPQLWYLTYNCHQTVGGIL